MQQRTKYRCNPLVTLILYHPNINFKEDRENSSILSSLLNCKYKQTASQSINNPIPVIQLSPTIPFPKYVYTNLRLTLYPFKTIYFLRFIIKT